ncbi:TetR/AcrR family transcriptional regulator C-terminal domain-containing protein [Enterococcus xiangfangensis]|uniref:TetR/AcrR family transcriptional regulator C-terminal domain-containing protein n=1 Tax=Enterococcus xiangfangensis TaxID=1296537 RepID=UPI001FD29809|nr:TetR/AcrR family transcriptional regulator C-terminal domain-containing protein [Enterococcus xiangfangensis]MBM7710829.1 AcrR family transcriptional regulator [Enterococcus xiangfangensis]
MAENKLTREKIVQEAFDLLAENQTIEALSMRKLATRLHVQAPALYWYFNNKQALLQKMIETMEEELIIPDQNLVWHEQLFQFMESYYDLYTKFPCGAELEIHTVPAYPSRLEHLETMAQLLISIGLSPVESHNALLSMHHLLIGQLIDQQHEDILRKDSLKKQNELMVYVTKMRDYANEHQLSSLVENFAHRRQQDPKANFLNSIRIYLAGIEKKLS